MKLLSWSSPRSIGRALAGLLVLGLAGSASAQYATTPARTYRPAQRRFYQRSYPATPRRVYQARPALPYNLSPYTDDWSTGRHLPYPKPWMLPTRDPAYRGR